MRICKTFTLLFILFLVFSFRVNGSYGLKMERCFIESIGEEVICGTYEVMENRQVRKGAKIRLNFIILPARTSRPAPDPIFVFSGGPGQGSAQFVEAYAWEYEKLRWERDIVLVDQRGTGDSHPLPCQRIGDPNSAQTYLQDMFPEDYVKKCRKDLEKRANLRYYHTTLAVADIDDLRAELGYDWINVAGASYGSYTAYVYMRNYPERTRCAVLEFGALPNWDYSGTIAPNTQAALERLFVDCAADPVCSVDYPRLEEHLEQALSRLRQGPVLAPIINPVNGNYEMVTFTYNNFIHGLRSMLYSVYRSCWIPAFLHWAAQGNYSPIAEYTAKYLWGINRDLKDGMFLSVTCTETIPFINYAEARRQAQGTFMGEYRLDQQKNACDLWVRGDLPLGFRELTSLEIPALIISGELDPVTPPQYGAELADYLPQSLHVIIPNSAHGYSGTWENGMDDVVAQFVSQGTTYGLDVSCVLGNQRPPWISWRDYTAPDGSVVPQKIRSQTSNINTRDTLTRR